MRVNDDVEGTYHLMHYGRIFDHEDALGKYKMMGAMYVQAIVDNLNERSPDLPSFNASKLLNPKYYPSDEEVHITMSKQHLERLIVKFGLMVVERDASRAELLEFVENFEA
jgi:hypothetical protein